MPSVEDQTQQLLTKESHDKYKYEFNRLKTFNLWPQSAPISPASLARAGFYNSGDNQSVICFECGGRVIEWSPEDSPLTKHRQHFPNCKFVIGSSDNIKLVDSQLRNNQSLNHRLLLSSSDPSPSVSPINSNSSDSSLSTSPSMISSIANEHIIESADEFETLLRNRHISNSRSDVNMNSFYQLMKSERNRLRSYYIRDNCKWNVPFIRPEDLAKAGLFFLNDDRVQCAFCTGVISSWSQGMYCSFNYLFNSFVAKIVSFN